MKDGTRVTFVYNKRDMSWKAKVFMASNEAEARQAFKDVVLACEDVHVSLEPKTKRLALGLFEIIMKS